MFAVVRWYWSTAASDPRWNKGFPRCAVTQVNARIEDEHILTFHSHRFTEA